MRSTWAGWIALLALVGAGLWGSSALARAEDPAERSAITWRFDVRVLRLSTACATVEQAPTLPGMTACGVTTATWAALLAALKARGSTQIVMDRNVTGLSDRAFSVGQTQTENVMAVRRTDGTSTITEALPFMSAANVDLVVDRDGGRRLEYGVNITWAKAAAHTAAPISVRTEWKGAQMLQGDGTLVLRHAEQDGQETGTEIYVLITWDAP